MFTQQIRKIGLQYIEKSIAYQTTMQFDRIVIIHKMVQLLLPIVPNLEPFLTCHISISMRMTRSGLTVGLQADNMGEFLPDIVRVAVNAERVVGTIFVLNTIIRINALYRLAAAVNHIAQQKLGGTDCGTVSKMAAYHSREKSSIATNR